MHQDNMSDKNYLSDCFLVFLIKYQSEYFAFLCLRFRDYKKRGIVGLSLCGFSCSEFCSRLEIVAFALL